MNVHQTGHEPERQGPCQLTSLRVGRISGSMVSGRPPVQPDGGLGLASLSALLDALLGAVVMGLAEGLEGTGPEALLIATVRLDVIADGGDGRSTLSLAHAAQRLAL